MKLLFVGDFSNKSSNVSQRNAFLRIGIKVISYPYRDKHMLYGKEKGNEDLIETCKREKPDFVLISKGNGISVKTIIEMNKVTKTVLWYMDATNNFDKEIEEKIKYCNIVFCEKMTVIKQAEKIRKDIIHLIEGVDETVFYPIEITQDINISFIGTIYNNRKDFLPSNTKIFGNVFNVEHSNIVSRSKINLNFCTLNTASNRIFKILASKGFLLTDDWMGRDDIFKDHEDLVIFKDKQDLNEKVEYYLKNEVERKRIAENGFKTAQKFNKQNWAKTIVNSIDPNFVIKQKIVSKDKISFLLYSHNRDNQLEKTLFSLSKQKNKNFELLVVETANLNSTIDILKKYSQQFHIECFQLHLKLVDKTRCLNFLADKAKDIICIIDSDVIKMSDYTQEVFDKINENNFLIQNVKRLNEEQTKLVTNEDINEEINSDSISQIAVLKQNFLEIGGYDERFFGWGGEDNDLNNRLKNIGLEQQYLNSIGLHQYHKKSYEFRTFKSDNSNSSYMLDNFKHKITKNVFFFERKDNQQNVNSNFEKIKLDDTFEFSYIIGYRKNNNREKNLESVLEWLNENRINNNFEIIIVEQDIEKKCSFKNCKHIFVYNKNVYNRSLGFNVGALKSNSEVLIFADCDILMKWENLMNSVEHCKTYWEAINPKGQWFDLSISQFDVKKDIKDFPFSLRKGFNFCSGITLMRKEAFFKINGWDEDLRGWGAEDNIMSIKIQKMLDRYKTIKFPIFHLHHQINEQDIFDQKLKYELNSKHEFFNENMEKINIIKNLDKNQLFDYYKNKKIGFIE